MIECRGRVGLAKETRLGSRVEVVVRQQELERYRAAHTMISGAINNAHPAGTERFAKIEVRDRATGETEWIRHSIRSTKKSGRHRRELSARRGIRAQEGLK